MRDVYETPEKSISASGESVRKRRLEDGGVDARETTGMKRLGGTQHKRMDKILPSPVNTLIEADDPHLSSRLDAEDESTPRLNIKELKRKESRLDSDIRRLQSRLETLRRAKAILLKGETKSTEDLIVKWRDIAQRASDQVLESAVEKVNKSGGKCELKRLERTRLKEKSINSIDFEYDGRIAGVTSCGEYQSLGEDEQLKIIEGLEAERQKDLQTLERRLASSDAEDSDTEEFTMRDLYKRLKLDYKLVFPDDHTATE